MAVVSRKTLLFLFTLLQYLSWACECDTLPKLEPNYISKQELIFHGYVQSVSACRDNVAKARFKIVSLYKGIATQEIDIYFDCEEKCPIKFAEGEQWVIYAYFEQIGKPKIMRCSRSKKLIENEARVKSLYIEGDLSFEEELDYLEKNFSKKTFLADNNKSDLSHRNIIPSGGSRILLIIISLLGLLIIYFFMRKKLR